LKTSIQAVKSFIKRYETVTIIGASVLFLLVIGSTALFGYAILSVAAPEVQAQGTVLAEEKAGFIKQAILDVAVGWIEENIASAESAQVVDGIACLAAVGGPSPQELLKQARQKIIDPLNIEKLDELTNRITDVVSQTTGTAACTNWILGG
jgi:hypothetical protein